MVKGWIKLIVVLLTGAFSVGFPVANSIAFGAPSAFIWWVFGFQLIVFVVSVLVGAFTSSKLGSRRFWPFLVYVCAYVGIMFGALRLHDLVTSANGWSYRNDTILPIMFGFLVCGPLWRPDFLKPYAKLTSIPVPSQPKV